VTLSVATHIGFFLYKPIPVDMCVASG